MKRQMKRLMGTILLIATMCFASACGGEEETRFTLSAQEQEAYGGQVDRVLDEFYWSYDRDSLSFYGGTVPTAAEETFLASEACEYALRQYAGSDAVIGQATLLHYNGDVAGNLEVTFLNDTLVGICYYGGYDNQVYSLLERNPYLADGGFEAYENWTVTGSNYREARASIPAEGFVTFYNGKPKTYGASIVEGKVKVYHLSGTIPSVYTTLTGGGGYEAMSASFMERNGSFLLAVLYGEMPEEAFEMPEDAQPAKIVWYNTKFQEVNETALGDAAFSAICAEGDELLVFSQNAVEVYTEGADGWSSTRGHYLRHRVRQCHITDLDGNGVKEYLMTDGLDLYVYQHGADGQTDMGFQQIWSTHLGVESLYGALYSGDLNQDGVKEIYVCDATGTTIRYILTEKGIRSSNEDIDYGQAIYPADWNQDGVDDYCMIAPAGTGMESKFYLSQGQSPR